MSRILIHEHWGENRNAKIFYKEEFRDGVPSVYEVDFYEDKQLRETRQMVTDGIPHSERYAEDAAENWCLGYIP